MKTFKLAALGLSLALATACSKDDAADVVNNIDDQPDLQASFLSNCATSNILDLAFQEKVTFTGNKVTREMAYYENADCTDDQTGGTLTLEGDFVVDADGLNESEAGAIEIEYTKATLKAEQDYLVNRLNDVGFCDRSDYKLDEEADITGGTDAALCPVQDVPEKVYGAYKLEGDNLFLNSGGFGEMGQSTDDRPTDLDKEAAYVRQ